MGDGWVLMYEDPDFGIFPGDNEGMGLGSVPMARSLSRARNYFGFLERFWLMERVQGDYPAEVKEESLAFYNKIAAEQGFEDSIRALFLEQVPELAEGCLPNNVWHHPLASDFMESSTGLRSQRCNDITQRFRATLEASPCLASYMAQESKKTSESWTTLQKGLVEGLGRVATVEEPFVPESQKNMLGASGASGASG